SPRRPGLVPRRGRSTTTHIEVRPLAKTPRTWTGARTPSGLKRVRQAERRHEILQPRRTAAKTYVAKALDAATNNGDGAEAAAALAVAHAALDRAAKGGAIHPNAAGRRTCRLELKLRAANGGKARLTLKFNAATGGAQVQTSGRVTKQTSKAQAAKAARSRIAAGKADKAKGAQTAAGKARTALSKTARADAAARAEAATGTVEAVAAPAKSTTTAKAKAAPKTTTKVAAPKATAKKAPAKKAPAKKA